MARGIRREQSRQGDGLRSSRQVIVEIYCREMRTSNNEFLSPLAPVRRGEGLGVRGFSSVVRLALQRGLFAGEQDSTSLVERSPHPQPLSPDY